MLFRSVSNRVESIFDGEIFHTVSLCGLKPDTTYYFRVKAKAPVWEFRTNDELAAAEREKKRETASADVKSFRTLMADAPPKTYHVSPDGDDRRDGLSPATAWRTLRHAVAGVIAGDTVLVHEGTYEEYVPLRATGDRDRPITFKAVPGAKVWLDGSGAKRPTAFRLAFKHNIIMDGFYLHNFRPSQYQSSSEGGAIHVIGGSNHIFRRCFYDGRSINYMPFFVLASDTRDFTVENCVIINGWNGAYFMHCPGLMIRHCVFYNGLICNINISSTPEQTAVLSHNLICDITPQKRFGNALISLWHLESYRGDHNVFFCHLPADKRAVIGYDRINGGRKEGKLTLPEIQKQTGQEQHSVFANPGIPVVAEMRSNKEDEDYYRLEMHKEKGRIAPLDFKDFFADPAGPCGKAADGKPIGLDPAAFEDKNRIK